MPKPLRGVILVRGTDLRKRLEAALKGSEESGYYDPHYGRPGQVGGSRVRPGGGGVLGGLAEPEEPGATAAAWPVDSGDIPSYIDKDIPEADRRKLAEALRRFPQEHLEGLVLVSTDPVGHTDQEIWVDTASDRFLSGVG